MYTYKYIYMYIFIYINKYIYIYIYIKLPPHFHMGNKHRVRKIKWTASNSIATKRRSGTLAASFPGRFTPTECLNRWPGFCPKLSSIDTVFGYCFQWFSTIISMEMTPKSPLPNSLLAILCKPLECSLPGSSVHANFPSKNTGVGCHFLL